MIDPAGGTYYIHVYRGGAMDGTRVEAGPAPELRGDGTLRATRTRCGQTTTAEWKLDALKVVKRSETTTGTYDASQCAR